MVYQKKFTCKSCGEDYDPKYRSRTNSVCLFCTGELDEKKDYFEVDEDALVLKALKDIENKDIYEEE